MITLVAFFIHRRAPPPPHPYPPSGTPPPYPPKVDKKAVIFFAPFPKQQLEFNWNEHYDALSLCYPVKALSNHLKYLKEVQKQG